MRLCVWTHLRMFSWRLYLVLCSLSPRVEPTEDPIVDAAGKRRRAVSVARFFKR